MSAAYDSHHDDATDITLEVFNHCDGSCTGCMLSTTERRDAMPVMALSGFRRALDAVSAWGKAKGLQYRPVLLFGDLPWLPLDIQRNYYAAVAERGLKLGVTMTLVDDARTEHYRQALALILEADPVAVFDITVDPVRLERQPAYEARLREAIAVAPHLHLQVLLSEAVLTHYAPEALAELLEERLGPQSVSLGFTPTLENLERRNYRYEVGSAAGYARRFYRHTEAGRAHLARELERYEASGEHLEFLGQTFHIGPDLSVYPVAYTIWGDVILDARNGGKALGRIEVEQGLEPLLTGMAAQRQSIVSATGMSRGGFGCDECDYRASCQFNGIGAARRLYRDFETRTGSCYGPREVDGVLAGMAAE